MIDAVKCEPAAWRELDALQSSHTRSVSRRDAAGTVGAGTVGWSPSAGDQVFGICYNTKHGEEI